jgi:hypothetical protein
VHRSIPSIAVLLSSAGQSEQLSHSCKFNARSGALQTQPYPKAQPIPVGAPSARTYTAVPASPSQMPDIDLQPGSEINERGEASLVFRYLGAPPPTKGIHSSIRVERYYIPRCGFNPYFCLPLSKGKLRKPATFTSPACEGSPIFGSARCGFIPCDTFDGHRKIKGKRVKSLLVGMRNTSVNTRRESYLIVRTRFCALSHELIPASTSG